MQQSQPPKQEKKVEKKSDAWSMASSLVDLDGGFGKKDPKYAAFDPKTAAQPQQRNDLPNLSSYGQVKPDLSGFGGLAMGNMGMGQMNNRGPPQQQRGMGMSGMNQMGMNMNQRQMQPQQQPRMNNMNQMGMGQQMGMNQMGMNQMGQPRMSGMNQMNNMGMNNQRNMNRGMGGFGQPQQQNNSMW